VNLFIHHEASQDRRLESDDRRQSQGPRRITKIFVPYRESALLANGFRRNLMSGDVSTAEDS
jgi:hypothetical protein